MLFASRRLFQNPGENDFDKQLINMKKELLKERGFFVPLSSKLKQSKNKKIKKKKILMTKKKE